METKQIKLTDDQKAIIKEAFTLEVDRVTESYYGKGGGIEQGYYDEREYRKDIAKVMDTYELIMSSFDKNWQINLEMWNKSTIFVDPFHFCGVGDWDSAFIF